MTTDHAPDPEGRTSRFVEAEDGTRLHALDWGGDGPPALLIHGARRTGRSWNAVARRLREDYRVIALDSRAHGDSGDPPTGYRAVERAGDIAAVANGLDLPPHFVIGHSLGGGSGALYAARNPGAVRGAVLVEPTPSGPDHWQRVGMFDDDWKPARETQGRNGWSSIDELRGRLEANRMTSTWTKEVLEDVLREETILHEDGSVSIKWSPSFYNFDELRTDEFALIDEADSMTMPVLVMVAASNNLLESHLKPFAYRLPRGEFAAIEGVGHSIYMEDPDLVAERTRVFFKASASAG